MKPLQFPLNVKVAERSGAYNTAAVAGQRASCTRSAEAAIGSLVDKLTAQQQLPIGTLQAVQLPAKGLAAGVSMWQIKRRADQAEPFFSCVGHEFDVRP